MCHMLSWHGHPVFGSSDESQHGHPASKCHKFSSECQRQGGGAHLAVNKWLKLICRNSFTNHNQQLMCFGRWKQQKSVFRSRTGWTLSHLAQTCLQCPTNPLPSCLHYPHVHWTCTTDNRAVFGKQNSDSPPSPPRDHIQNCFKAGFVSHWKVFFIQAFREIKQANPLGNVVFASISSGHLCSESGMSCFQSSTVLMHRSHQLFQVIPDGSSSGHFFEWIYPPENQTMSREVRTGLGAGMGSSCAKVSYRCSPQCLRGLWTMPLIICFNWVSLRQSDRWT